MIYFLYICTMEVDKQVNSPTYYNLYTMEVIDMMVEIFGKKETSLFCEMNAFKYRMRLGKKKDINVDLEKEEWYLKKARQLRV